MLSYSKRALLLSGVLLASPLLGEYNYKSHPDQIMIGVGAYEIMRPKGRTPQVQFEYRWDPDCYRIRPLVGAYVSYRGSVYVFGGVGYDIYFGRHVVLTPSFAPGLYYKGKGRELGFPLEFRSSIEIAYETKNKMRFGAQFFHISNASLGWKNPGEESLIFFWAFPIGKK